MDCCGESESPGLPQTYNFLPKMSGDTWQGIKFTVVINDEPEDFEDCVVEIGFRKYKGAATLDWLISSDNGGITIDENEITIVPRILTLKAGKYFYDLQVTYPDSSVRTYLEGSFKVLNSITP